ncbi:MAG: sigma 54-interacting transcriptional regulator [Candidatus Aureabacteria bacterium]|nr:sigma 54-interacting transcriptional regulator [Candidatus Auribacterota bacterium]
MAEIYFTNRAKIVLIVIIVFLTLYYFHLDTLRELQYNLINVSESAAIAALSIIAFPVLLGLLLSTSCRGMRDLSVTVLCAVAFLALDYYLFAAHGTQLNTVYPLLAIVASSLALSAHARIVREQRASRVRNSVLKMGLAIRSARDSGELSRVILDALAMAVGADRGMIFSCGEEARNGEEFPVECERNMPAGVISGDEFACGREIISSVRSTREGMVIRNMRKGKLLAHPQSGSEGLPRSVLCFPLSHRQAPLRIIYMESDALENVFLDDSTDVITALAAQAAAVMENELIYSTGRQAKNNLREEDAYVKREIEQTQRLSYIVGNSTAIQACLALVSKASKSDITVLIEGETGTGKELIAKAIHFTGPREAAMFVAQNCSALPESLLESELFGHKRGAFTGAVKDKKGLLEIADGGTIFLDEVADMPPALQAKLLRVLQEGVIRPVGGVKEKRVDLRIISATNKNLAEEMKAGRFREDLYYRLNAFTIHVPPLRARREDIPVLAMHFVERICKWLKKDIKGISGEAMARLVTHDFPGNVRELENEMEKAIVMASDGDMITTDGLSEKIQGASAAMPEGDEHHTMKEAIISLERKLIARALQKHHGNKSRTAQELGISRRGLAKMIERIKSSGLSSPPE